MMMNEGKGGEMGNNKIDLVISSRWGNLKLMRFEPSSIPCDTNIDDPELNSECAELASCLVTLDDAPELNDDPDQYILCADCAKTMIDTMLYHNDTLKG